MPTEMKKIKFTKEMAKEYALLLLGNTIFAVGAIMFVEPYGFAPGGTYGLGMVAHHLWGMETEIAALCLDIPLLIIGTLVLGGQFGIKTLVSTLYLPLIMRLIHMTYGYDSIIEPGIAEIGGFSHQMLAALFGGVIYGLGLGIIFKSKATSGGSDIISMIFSKYSKISLGTAMIIVDGIITLTTVIAFGDWKLPMYSWVIIFVCSKVVDMIVEGSPARTMLIITEKVEDVRHIVLEEMDRGATLIPAKGMYRGQPRDLLYVVLNRRQMMELKRRLAEIDPTAFVNIINSGETLGEGFKNLNE